MKHSPSQNKTSHSPVYYHNTTINMSDPKFCQFVFPTFWKRPSPKSSSHNSRENKQKIISLRLQTVHSSTCEKDFAMLVCSSNAYISNCCLQIALIQTMFRNIDLLTIFDRYCYQRNVIGPWFTRFFGSVFL